jgi:hypothetical protein
MEEKKNDCGVKEGVYKATKVINHIVAIGLYRNSLCSVRKEVLKKPLQ